MADTVKWGTPADHDAFGTGANPTDITAADGGTLRFEFTRDDVTRTISAPVRHAPGTGPTIEDQPAWTVGETSVNIDASASGSNLTFTYTMSGAPAGVTIDGSTGAITGTPTESGSGTITVTPEDQHGRTVEYVETFGWSAALPAVGTFGALTNQTFLAHSGDRTYRYAAATGPGLTWTYAQVGWVAGVTHDPATRTFTFDTNALAVQSGTSLTVSATDQFGRAAAGSPRSFVFDIENFTLTQTAGGELEIDGATGEVTVTITSPAAYADYDAGNGAGVFVFDSADLASGPVNLVPPRIVDDGTPADGEELTVTPGLWVYDPDVGNLGLASYQWQADVAGNGTFANLAGATAAACTLTASESGDGVRVQETLSDDGGSRTATSAAVSVAAAAPSGPAITRVGVQHEDHGETQTPAGVFDLSALAAGDTILVAYGPGLAAVSLTVNGNPATLVEGASASGIRDVTVFEYTLQAGDLGAAVTVEADLGAGVAEFRSFFAVYSIGSASVVSHDWGQHWDGGPDTYLLTTNDALANAVIGFFMGEDGSLIPDRLSIPPGLAPDYQSTTGIDPAEAAVVITGTNVDPAGGIAVSGDQVTDPGRFAGVMVLVE